MLYSVVQIVPAVLLALFVILCHLALGITINLYLNIAVSVWVLNPNQCYIFIINARAMLHNSTKEYPLNRLTDNGNKN